MTNITETEALNKVAAYCSTAEHCRAEISENYSVGDCPMMSLTAFSSGW